MHGEPTRKQNGGIRGPDGVSISDDGRIDPAVEFVNGHAIVDHPAFPIGQIIHPHQLALEGATDRDDAISAIGAVTFVVANAGARAAPEIVSAATIFGGMHCQHVAMIGPTLFDPDHGVGGEPVVGVDDIEMAVAIFFLKEMPDKRAAHLLNFIDEIAVEVEWTKMVPDAVDLQNVTGAIAGTSEDVDVMAFALESRRQFGNMRRYSPDRYRMERFPGEHGNSHNANSKLQLARASSDISENYSVARHPE